MTWTRPFAEIAAVASECVQLRKAGFDTPALAYPRDELALKLLCAFNGIKPEQAPRGWHYFPNAATAKAWGRVADAAREAMA